LIEWIFEEVFWVCCGEILSDKIASERETVRGSLTLFTSQHVLALSDCKAATIARCLPAISPPHDHVEARER